MCSIILVPRIAGKSIILSLKPVLEAMGNGLGLEHGLVGLCEEHHAFIGERLEPKRKDCETIKRCITPLGKREDFMFARSPGSFVACHPNSF